jgi:hypothetical protein
MQPCPFLDKFLLEEFSYPNDASKLVIVAGDVESKESLKSPLLEYRVGPQIIIQSSLKASP